MAKKNVENQFKEWLDSLTVKRYPLVRKEIIDRCNINDQIFRHWKAGNSKIPDLAQKEINKIARKKIFKDLET